MLFSCLKNGPGVPFDSFWEYIAIISGYTRPPEYPSHYLGVCREGLPSWMIQNAPFGFWGHGQGVPVHMFYECADPICGSCMSSHPSAIIPSKRSIFLLTITRCICGGKENRFEARVKPPNPSIRWFPSRNPPNSLRYPPS